MKNSLLIYTLLLLIIFPIQAQNYEDTLMIFGRSRFYKVHLPIGYNYQKEYPCVFVFHGGLGNADNVEKMTGFSKKADDEGFIVVYPYGTGAFDKKLLTWNTWDCCGYADKKNIDEVSFVNSVLQKVKSEYQINEKMIYASGMSNGGMMCYLLACLMSDQFAAVAPVAATMFPGSSCIPKPELSIIIFNSIDDKHIPYEGGIGEESIVKVEKNSVEEVVDFWKNNFYCAFINNIEGPDFHRATYRNRNGTEVIFYKMLKGGHTWPGGEKVRLLADRPIKNVSATDLIWEFFKDHPKQ